MLLFLTLRTQHGTFQHSFRRLLHMPSSMKSIVLPLVFLVGAFQLGCSSGRSGLTKAKYCTSQANPLLGDQDGAYNRKVQVKPGEDFVEQAGDYAFQSAEFFYHDTAKDIKMHFAIAPNAAGEVTASVVCLGGKGINPDMPPLAISIDIMSDLYFDSQKNTLLRTRNFNVDLQRRPAGQKWLEYSTSIVKKDFEPGDVNNFYGNSADATHIFIQLKSDSTALHQLISHLDTPAFDDKSGKDGAIIQRVLVNYKIITDDERKKIDE